MMRDRMNKMANTSSANEVASLMVVGVLLAMLVVMVRVHWVVGIVLACVPFVLIGLLCVLRKPYWGYTGVLLVNFLVIPLIRYTQIEGWSVLVDVMLLLTFVSLIINRAVNGAMRTDDGFRVWNGLLVASLIWVLFCVMELFNPTAMVSAWFTSRGTIAYPFLMFFLTTMLIRDFKQVESILVLISIMTLIGVGKGAMQQFMGFDSAERIALAGPMGTTHLLGSGTRYFSIYASAGIFGAMMGHAMVLFGIVAIYVKGKYLKAYFVFVALAALYGLMISGTRGALAVPAAGFLLFVVLSRKLRIIIPSVIIMFAAYTFLAWTTIGQSNQQIRRMRTALDFNDPSLQVRLENQRILGQYLADRPMGEGLGLSGVEAVGVSERFTTSIPTDSWYVKIWVETGIIGLCLYVTILLYIIFYGSYIVLFKIKDRQIRGVLIGLLCGILGIFVSSYGNMVLGQYPVVMVVYMSAALVFMGPSLDRHAQRKLDARASE